MTLGWIYRFSKRTELVVAYYKMDNKLNGQYSTGPAVNAVQVAPGADTTGAGVGLIHFF
jgi:predicted porin